MYTKQPLRIAQVLKQVYPVDPSNVDDELVERFDYLISASNLRFHHRTVPSIKFCTPHFALIQSYPVFPLPAMYSIQYPAQNPNAPEVFYRVIAKNGNGPPVFIDDLLSTLKVPLLLLWGAKDPWIRPQVCNTASPPALSILLVEYITTAQSLTPYFFLVFLPILFDTSLVLYTPSDSPPLIIKTYP